MRGHLKVGSTNFELTEWGLFEPDDEDALVLHKSPKCIDKLGECLRDLKIEHIFELGILFGGSVAYFAEAYKPRRIVAVDIAPAAPALDRWIERHNAGDRVKTYYGVDQGNAARIDSIYRDCFGSGEIDLIMDDASHELERTRISFNTLFPHVREGGIYIIEDWAWSETWRDTPGILPDLQAGPPLSTLVYEIVVASALGKGLIENVLINEYFIAVKRGPAAITRPFDIRHYA